MHREMIYFVIASTSDICVQYFFVLLLLMEVPIITTDSLIHGIMKWNTHHRCKSV